MRRPVLLVDPLLDNTFIYLNDMRWSTRFDSILFYSIANDDIIQSERLGCGYQLQLLDVCIRNDGRPVQILDAMYAVPIM